MNVTTASSITPLDRSVSESDTNSAAHQSTVAKADAQASELRVREDVARLRSMVRSANTQLRQSQCDIEQLREAVRVRDIAITVRDVELQDLRARTSTRLWRLTEIIREFAVFFGLALFMRLKRKIQGSMRPRAQAAGSAQPQDQMLDFSPPINDDHAVGDISFPVVVDPVVSIVIPVFGQIAYTLNCLRALSQHKSRYCFEVIVIDDCSVDETPQLLPKISGLRLIRSPENRGFILSCNAAAKSAKGNYLVFLNNDTKVEDGWLDALIRTFETHPQAGLVGSKLIYPDGTLQEAGGIVFCDGSAWNYGRGDDAKRSRFNYMREVDYCSGASIAIPTKLFFELNCFDESFAPAYFEDTDLAFRVRQSGKKVYYQPHSAVIHYEGKTSGTDEERGAKQYQVINQEKFFHRWKEALSSHGSDRSHEGAEAVRDRGCAGRALLIEVVIPTPDQDAGSGVVMDAFAYLQGLNYKCTVLPEESLAYYGEYTTALQAMGIEVVYGIPSIVDHLRTVGDIYDLIVVFRSRLADTYRDDLRTYCPSAKIVFHTQDLNYLRFERSLAFTPCENAADQKALLKSIEIESILELDHSIVVSEFEKTVLDSEGVGQRVTVVPMTAAIHTPVPGFDLRDDLCYVGNYSHPPNADAVLFFVREIFPLIKAQVPKMKLFLIGRLPTKEMLELAGPDIIITGIAPDLGEYLNRCRLSVAPLRYGAGVKGKILTSLGYGLPCVSTSVAAEGIGLTSGHDAVVADEPEEFARGVVAAYTDGDLWQKLSSNGQKIVAAKYSRAQVNLAMSTILHGLNIRTN